MSAYVYPAGPRAQADVLTTERMAPEDLPTLAYERPAHAAVGGSSDWETRPVLRPGRRPSGPPARRSLPGLVPQAEVPRPVTRRATRERCDPQRRGRSAEARHGGPSERRLLRRMVESQLLSPTEASRLARVAAGALGQRLGRQPHPPGARPMFESLLPARPVRQSAAVRLLATSGFRWTVCVLSVLMFSAGVGVLAYLVQGAG